MMRFGDKYERLSLISIVNCCKYCNIDCRLLYELLLGLACLFVYGIVVMFYEQIK